MEDKIFSRKRFLLPKIKKKKSLKLACTTLSMNGNNYNAGAEGFGKKNRSDMKEATTRKLIKTFMIIMIAVCIANRIITTIEPTVDVICINMAKGIATQISNEQATVVMSNYKYDDLSTVVRDEEGKIRMIKMNVSLVNDITSDVALKIQQGINNYNKSSFYIRLGSFTGSKILSGRGPNVEIKMFTTGNVLTDLVSEFSHAGVNQTLHRIFLKIDCSISILTPFDTIEETITNQVLLAEAVIVGDVPATYYNLNGITNDELLEVMGQLGTFPDCP